MKSAICTESGRVAVKVPEVLPEPDEVLAVVELWLDAGTVPVTVKLSEDDVIAVRFPTTRVLDSPGSIEVGLKVQVAGAMLAHPRTIEPVNPTVVEADTVNCAWPVPTSTVSELGFADNVKGTTPVPVKVTVWGDPGPVSVRLNVPTLVPRADGAKLTLIEQLAPAFTTLPQLFDSE